MRWESELELLRATEHVRGLGAGADDADTDGSGRVDIEAEAA